jgi:hypothetical protein
MLNIEEIDNLNEVRGNQGGYGVVLSGTKLTAIHRKQLPAPSGFL